MGIDLPEPKTVKNYSGQIRLRMAKSLHEQAAQLAAKEGISLNQLICLGIQAQVSGGIVGEQIVNEAVRILTNEMASTIG